MRFITGDQLRVNVWSLNWCWFWTWAWNRSILILLLILWEWPRKTFFIDQDLLKFQQFCTASFFFFIISKQALQMPTMQNKIGVAKRPNGDKITNQSAPFQQVVPPLNGVAMSILSTASYRRQPPLKSIFIFVLSLNVTYSYYCIASSWLIHCSSCSWYRIGI